MGVLMKKYIIKDCPAFSACGICVSQEAECLCKDCTDCLLKQIVEKCEENKFIGYGAIEIENPLYGEIMQILEIEEVE